MSFKEYDDHVGLRIDYAKLPDKFVGIPLSLVKGTTVKNGNTYNIVRLTTAVNGSTFIQNLRSLHYTKFRENLDAMSIASPDEFLGKKYIFERTEFHVADPSVDSKPRWLPVKPHKGKKVVA